MTQEDAEAEMGRLQRAGDDSERLHMSIIRELRG